MPIPSARAPACDGRVVSRGRRDERPAIILAGEKGGAHAPSSGVCCSCEQLELISPDRFQFAIPNWGVRARNPRVSCTDPWRQAAAGLISWNGLPTRPPSSTPFAHGANDHDDQFRLPARSGLLENRLEMGAYRLVLDAERLRGRAQ